MSRDIVDRSVKTCRTLVVESVDAFGVHSQFGDEFSVVGEHADIAVFVEEEWRRSFSRARG
jgi:hypothetical protein